MGYYTRASLWSEKTVKMSIFTADLSSKSVFFGIVVELLGTTMILITYYVNNVRY